MTFSLPSPLLKFSRDLKQGPRRPREHHITIRLIRENNSYARPARVFYILIHFFCRCHLENDVKWSNLEDAITWRWILIFSLNVHAILTNFILGLWPHTFHAEWHGVIFDTLIIAAVHHLHRILNNFEIFGSIDWTIGSRNRSQWSATF